MLPYYMIESAHQNRYSQRKVYEIQFQRGQDLYVSRKNRGLLRRLAALFGGKRLQDLNERLANQKVVAQHASGRQSVRLDQIVGSQGRSADFDRDFNPLNSRSRQRWTSIAIAELAGVDMPAVDLVKIGREYYVRDGHHRISVARALGAREIDANVVEWVLQPQHLSEAASQPQLTDAMPC
jgi:hypothetical protein